MQIAALKAITARKSCTNRNARDEVNLVTLEVGRDMPEQYMFLPGRNDQSEPKLGKAPSIGQLWLTAAAAAAV